MSGWQVRDLGLVFGLWCWLGLGSEFAGLDSTAEVRSMMRGLVGFPGISGDGVLELRRGAWRLVSGVWNWASRQRYVRIRRGVVDHRGR